MKGARGLLISITGGKDLTLYEVDEAATRIREEVDQDANIIVGATFDESLEGIIRVSVVATGIDQASLSRPPVTAPEARIAELTQKLRADQQRVEQQQRVTPERIERQEMPSVSARALATPVAPPAPPQQSSEAIENAAKAAVAAAVLPMVEDVTIRPIPPKPSLFPEQMAAPPEQPAPRAFIPPAPERMVNRPPRMPRIDELPRPAQAELRAKRGEEVEAEHPEKRKVGLLRRLAAVGLGRREDEAEPEKTPVNVRPARPASAPAPRLPAERPVDRAPPPAPPRPTMPAPAQRAPEPVSEYARRPAHQGLDPMGRQAPVHNSPEEDQLDIPAFLRRQAN
jgi:cell division protein FtsZ